MQTKFLGACRTVQELKVVLSALPPDLPLCVVGEFDEFRPINANIAQHTFAEDELLRDREVIGAVLHCETLFE